MQGSRSGAVMATAWATLMHKGDNGYREIARNLGNLHARLKREIAAIPGVKLMGNADACVVAYSSDEFNIYVLADEMSKRGCDTRRGRVGGGGCVHVWCSTTCLCRCHLGRRGTTAGLTMVCYACHRWEVPRLQRPPCVHFCVGDPSLMPLAKDHTKTVADQYLDDLREAAKICMDTRNDSSKVRALHRTAVGLRGDLCPCNAPCCRAATHRPRRVWPASTAWPGRCRTAPSLRNCSQATWTCCTWWSEAPVSASSGH